MRRSVTSRASTVIPDRPAAVPPAPWLPDPLHIDERFVVFDKPSGLLSVPGIGPEKADCLVSRAQSSWPGIRIVHRLDRDTSGVIVLARDADAHRNLSIQFQDRRVMKRYVAVVAGIVADDEGTIDLPIRKDLDDPPRQRVCHEHGKASETGWRVLDRTPGDVPRTRLELFPKTGRSHQLRLHLKAIGHPILGDDLYAPIDLQAAASRLLLHASWLFFANPGDASPVEVASPAPF